MQVMKKWRSREPFRDAIPTDKSTSRAQYSVAFVNNSCGGTMAEIFTKYLLVTFPVVFMCNRSCQVTF